jgi:very-short-patch-repair endonuclease
MRDLADSEPGNRFQNLPRDLIAAELAGSQDGVVGFVQLRSLAISQSSVQRSVDAGRLHVVLPGVYAVGHPSISWRGRLRAAVLWGGEDAVLSHMTAATVRDLLSSASPTVHLTIPRGGRKSREWVRVHHTRRLDPAERSEVNGLPVTTVERTLIDLASVVRPERLERAVEQAVRMNCLDFGALKALRARNRRHRGMPALDTLIAAFDPRAPQTNPGIERRFLRLVRKYNLPRPQVNAQVGPYVVDFLWEAQKLIVELDSLEHHRRPSIFESDRKRDIDLQRLGYTVLRITHRRLQAEPAVMAQELRYFLSACGP